MPGFFLLLELGGEVKRYSPYLQSTLSLFHYSPFLEPNIDVIICNSHSPSVSKSHWNNISSSCTCHGHGHGHQHDTLGQLWIALKILKSKVVHSFTYWVSNKPTKSILEMMGTHLKLFIGCLLFVSFLNSLKKEFCCKIENLDATEDGEACEESHRSSDKTQLAN